MGKRLGKGATMSCATAHLFLSCQHPSALSCPLLTLPPSSPPLMQNYQILKHNCYVANNALKDKKRSADVKEYGYLGMERMTWNIKSRN